MSANSTRNSTFRELNELLNDEDFMRFSPVPNTPTTDENINERTPSSMLTTPDPLNIAILEESPATDTNDGRQFSQEYTYSDPTAREALTNVSGLTGRIAEDHTTIQTPRMVSTATMTQTPLKMVSTGTMPQTPQMAFRGALPRTPTPSMPTSLSVAVTILLGASSSATVHRTSASTTTETIDVRSTADATTTTDTFPSSS